MKSQVQGMEKKTKKNKFELIAIIGKSASGKNTILDEVLLSAEEPLHRVVQFTTRPKRPSEINYKDYIFLTQEEFNQKFTNDEILEVNFFRDWAYGTLISTINPNIPNIGVFNPDAILSLKETNLFDIKTYYIDASDKTRLLRSLTRQDNPDVDEIIRRFLAEKKEHADLSELEIKKTLTNEDDEDYDNCVEYILQAECLKSN